MKSNRLNAMDVIVTLQQLLRGTKGIADCLKNKSRDPLISNDELKDFIKEKEEDLKKIHNDASDFLRNNLLYVQGTLASLDPDDSFQHIDSFLPQGDKQTEKFLKACGEIKEGQWVSGTGAAANVISDVLAYEHGIGLNCQFTERQHLFLPSHEITLWSLLCWQDVVKFINLLVVENPEMPECLKALCGNNGERNIFLGLYDRELNKTQRFKTLQQFINNKEQFKNWVDELSSARDGEFKIENFPTEAFREKLRKFLCAVCDSSAEEETFDELLEGIKNYWSYSLSERKSSCNPKLTPRFSVPVEALIRSYDPEDRSLLFCPKVVYRPDESDGKSKIASYYIGTYRCADYKQLFGDETKIQKQKQFQEVIDELLNYCEFKREAVIRKNLDEKRLKLRARAEKAARAAVMARNMSHNLGSHVLFQLSQSSRKDKKYNLARAFDYLAERMEFIAQYFTTDRPILNGVYTLHDLLDRFIATYNRTSPCGGSIDDCYYYLKEDIDPKDNGRNYILQHLVASEGFGEICFSRKCSHGNSTGLCCHQEAGDRNHKECDCHESNVKKGSGNVCFQLILPDGKKAEDLFISIPGGVIGCQAFFIIMENFIRNSAKHGEFNQEKRLKVTLEVKEVKEVEDDYYEFVFRDNVTKSKYSKNGGEALSRVTEFEECIKKGLVDPSDGGLIYGGWGFKEMQFCAIFLQGRNLGKEIEKSEFALGPKAQEQKDNFHWGLKFGPVDGDDSPLLAMAIKLYKPKLLSLIKEKTGAAETGELVREFTSNSEINDILESRIVADLVVNENSKGLQNRCRYVSLSKECSGNTGLKLINTAYWEYLKHEFEEELDGKKITDVNLEFRQSSGSNSATRETDPITFELKNGFAVKKSPPELKEVRNKCLEAICKKKWPKLSEKEGKKVEIKLIYNDEADAS